MIKIHKLSLQDYPSCYNLLQNNLIELEYFKDLGWTYSQFENQFSKKINFSLGLFKNNILRAFIFGDLIYVENTLEYEIHLIYVANKDRKLGFASKLLENVKLTLKKNNLKKIYLEVAVDNLEAMRLYKKHNFIKTGMRKKYYNKNKQKIDAYFFEKKIDD